MPSPELGRDMQRRDFLTLLGGTTVTWPLIARASASTMRGNVVSGSKSRTAANP